LKLTSPRRKLSYGNLPLLKSDFPDRSTYSPFPLSPAAFLYRILPPFSNTLSPFFKKRTAASPIACYGVTFDPRFLLCSDNPSPGLRPSHNSHIFTEVKRGRNPQFPPSELRTKRDLCRSTPLRSRPFSATTAYSS